MSNLDVYKDFLTEFEKDLTNRREKNDGALGEMETAALRGEIQYIKTWISRIKERVAKNQ